jgi:hypothetical protein
LWINPTSPSRIAMKHRLPLAAWLTVTLSSASAYPPPPKAEAKPEYDKLAKEAADGFCQNIVKRDFDAVIKACDFPLIFEGGKVLEKAEDFRKELDGIPADALKDVKITVKEAMAVDKLEAWGKGLARPPSVLKKEDRLKAMKERVGKDGWVVALDAEHGGQKEDRVGLVLVLFKDGKPRIVGFGD